MSLESFEQMKQKLREESEKIMDEHILTADGLADQYKLAYLSGNECHCGKSYGEHENNIAVMGVDNRVHIEGTVMLCPQTSQVIKVTITKVRDESMNANKAMTLSEVLALSVSVRKTTLQKVFDAAVGSMDFASGFLDHHEVAALREVAGLLGVDPDEATPRNFRPWNEQIIEQIRKSDNKDSE